MIHAGAGGVGLAAIQIAQRRGARVLATAGSPVKRERLRSLGVEHTFDSRSLAFADERARGDGRARCGRRAELAGRRVHSRQPARARHERMVPRTGEARYLDAGTDGGLPDPTCAIERTTSAPKPMPIGRSWAVCSTTCARRSRTGALRPLAGADVAVPAGGRRVSRDGSGAPRRQARSAITADGGSRCPRVHALQAPRRATGLPAAPGRLGRSNGPLARRRGRAARRADRPPRADVRGPSASSTSASRRVPTSDSASPTSPTGVP